MKRVQAININELKNAHFVYDAGGGLLIKNTVTNVVINDEDEVYAQNGSILYKINFIQDLQEVIDKTLGNMGWYTVDKESGLKYIDLMINELYKKGYIGNEEQ
jgi:hypothetical protein